MPTAEPSPRNELKQKNQQSPNQDDDPKNDPQEIQADQPASQEEEHANHVGNAASLFGGGEAHEQKFAEEEFSGFGVHYQHENQQAIFEEVGTFQKTIEY